MFAFVYAFFRCDLLVPRCTTNKLLGTDREESKNLRLDLRTRVIFFYSRVYPTFSFDLLVSPNLQLHLGTKTIFCLPLYLSCFFYHSFFTIFFLPSYSAYYFSSVFRYRNDRITHYRPTGADKSMILLYAQYFSHPCLRSNSFLRSSGIATNESPGTEYISSIFPRWTFYRKFLREQQSSRFYPRQVFPRAAHTSRSCVESRNCLGKSRFRASIRDLGTVNLVDGYQFAHGTMGPTVQATLV